MIPASAQGATKLLEALEKLSQWAGEPSGGGPSGAPSRELVRAFEEALSTLRPVRAAPLHRRQRRSCRDRRKPCRARQLTERGRKALLPWSSPPQPVALMSPPGRR